MFNMEYKETPHSVIWAATDVAARVEKGAKWLDKVKPNWYLDIDIPNLDISDGSFCICGQVFMEEADLTLDEYDEIQYENGYEYAVQEVIDPYSEDGDTAERLGFNTLPKRDRLFEIPDHIVATFAYDGAPAYRAPYRMQKVEWELLATEWILQIEKRVFEYKTEICSACGTDEAMFQYQKVALTGPSDWPHR